MRAIFGRPGSPPVIVLSVAVALAAAIALCPQCPQCPQCPRRQDRPAPVAAAVELTSLRLAVFKAGGRDFTAVDVPGSPAEAADLTLASTLPTGPLAAPLDELGVEVLYAELLAEAGPLAQVALEYRLGPGEPLTATLHLRWTEAGWRVEQVE
ncbi:MAG: hypothetical protein FWG11_06755 [Promicromonosporaceae bacterium]|nr:hypothetical protein [Promicromonosporaceae bacterium]